MSEFMLAAILAAISGALGVVVGRFWDVHSESKRWRRDMRVRSYEGVAAAFYQYREVLREVSESPRNGVEFSKQVLRVWKSHEIWNKRLSSLWLHGSKQAVVTAYELDHELAKLGEWILVHPIPEAEWAERKEPAQKRFDDYVDAVRKDLALPSLKDVRAGAPSRLTPPPSSPPGAI
jgi:hypothetical protein